MNPKSDNMTAWIARRGGVIVNLVWIGTLIAAAPQIWPILGGAEGVRALGLAGLALRPWRAWSCCRVCPIRSNASCSP